MINLQTYIVGMYLRLSKEDERYGESVSISTQRSMIQTYCDEKGYYIYREYVDDGYSGSNFDRPGFHDLLKDVAAGNINTVITKDLSRLGRDYIMTGYYSEIFFQSQGIRYIAIADDVDSNNGPNDIAPFKNILNDMYARDISKKVKNAKRQRAQNGYYIGSQAPYGYRKVADHGGIRLEIDEPAAQNVRQIFALAAAGNGSHAIASFMEGSRVLSPAMYLFRNGDTRFAKSASVRQNKPYLWNDATISKILSNRIYLGELESLKTEVINHKTRHRVVTPKDGRIITPNAHIAIISQEQFSSVQLDRAKHHCPARQTKEYIFRDLLYCECCGHKLTIAKKKLIDRDAEIYFCSFHFRHPEICPKTHRVYHDMLYQYVLQEIRDLAKSMKKRKVNTSVMAHTALETLTAEVLRDVIDRIEIGHLTKRSRPGSVIRIHWKLG